MLKPLHFFNYIRTPLFAPDPEPGGGDDEAAKKAAAEKERQAALDKQFAERAERGKEQGKKEILDLLGIDDPEEAKKLIESARKADEASKSELEKEQAARAKAEKEAAEAKAEAEKILAEARNRVLNSEIKTSALAPVLDKDKKITRPAFKAEAIDDVLLLVKRDGIKDEDGKFAGVEEALKELAKAKPWLLAEETTERSKGNNVRLNQQRKDKSGDGESRERIVKSL